VASEDLDRYKTEVLPREENVTRHKRQILLGDYRRKLNIETQEALTRVSKCVWSVSVTWGCCGVTLGRNSRRRCCRLAGGVPSPIDLAAAIVETKIEAGPERRTMAIICWVKMIGQMKCVVISDP
jgi:hypothetical protein